MRNWFILTFVLATMFVFVSDIYEQEWATYLGYLFLGLASITGFLLLRKEHKVKKWEDIINMKEY